MLSFTILIDNRKYPEEHCIQRACAGAELHSNGKRENETGIAASTLHIEHGFSLYLQYNEIKILCDTGATGLFAENASRLGIDLSNLDFVFLSHGHNDHTGGIERILSNPASVAPVYISDHTRGTRYFSLRHAGKREIGMDPTLLTRYKERFHFVTKSCRITKDISLVSPSCRAYPQPEGNRYLIAANAYGEKKDSFLHEIALAINMPEGLVIISPCSHNGVANIIESCQTFTGQERVYAFIGGMHLIDECEKENGAADLATLLTGRYPGIRIYTGHCTGEAAWNEIQKNIPPGQARLFYSGYTETLG